MVTMDKVKVQLSVKADLYPEEVCYVVGDLAQMGAWNPDVALVMEKTKDNVYVSPIIYATADSVIRYRYLTCVLMEKPETRLMFREISRWESNLKSRHVTSPVQGDLQAACDIFGLIDDRLLVSTGWLRECTEIRLRLHGSAVRMSRSKLKGVDYRIYFYAIDIRVREPTDGLQEEEEDSRGQENVTLPCHTPIYVANMKDRSDCDFHRQKDHMGTEFKQDLDYLVIQLRTSSLDNLVIRADLFAKDSAIGSERLASGCFPMFLDHNNDFGPLIMPLFDKKQRHIGQLVTDYVLMHPVKPRSIHHENMHMTYTRHWKKRLTLNVGHRGMGNSYSKFALARENTIRSLKEAGDHGCDFVEFDVQLSRDRIPIIFHDFHVKTLVKARNRTGQVDIDLPRNVQATHTHEAVVTPLNQLKLRQLRMLSLCHVKKDEVAYRSDQIDGELDDNVPFPTLKQALRHIHTHVGFNIEIKYPAVLQNGQSELGPDSFFLNRNEYLDKIVNVVLNDAGERRIVFSSFDPECCVMIQLKQNKYPVLFLTQGKTTRYMPFLDPRANDSHTAVSFAITNQILGVSFQAEELLVDSSPLERAKMHGLVSFIWGDDLDDVHNYRRFRDLGADGVICDRIEGKMDRKTNIFMVERQHREGSMEESSSNGSRTPSPSVGSNKSTDSSQQQNDDSSVFITPPDFTNNK